MNAPFVLAAVVATLVLVGSAGPARADAIHECVQAAHDGQALRDAGKLAAARRAFVICSADACPAVVRDSCRRWDAEVEPRVPTVTFAASGASGEDLADVHVSLDGAPIAASLDGRAVAVDPGAHEVVFEKPGLVTWRREVVIREGEKGRVIAARLARPATAPPRSLAPLIVSGAVAGVGLAGFAAFGLVGKSQHDHLASTCAPSETCDPGDVRAARDAWIAADVSLAVGLVGAGLFTAFALAPVFRARPSPSRSALPPSVSVAPGSNGASLVLRWQH